MVFTKPGFATECFDNISTIVSLVTDKASFDCFWYIRFWYKRYFNLSISSMFSFFCLASCLAHFLQRFISVLFELLLKFELYVLQILHQKQQSSVGDLNGCACIIFCFCSTGTLYIYVFYSLVCIALQHERYISGSNGNNCAKRTSGRRMVSPCFEHIFT
jgi:hypothetical protein